MSRLQVLRWTAALAVGLLFGWESRAGAQFFLGGPSVSANTTAGTITQMPIFTANNITREIDITGQLHVMNAGAGVQTVSFNVQWALDPTYNSGNPQAMQLQLNQSGFVTVPGGGQIYGWNIHASVYGPPGAIQGFVNDFAPGAPYFGGTTFYGPTTTFGGNFIYNPATASIMDLSFVSTFDGLSTNNLYIWDFPIGLQFVPIPEPASVGLVVAGACGIVVALARYRRRRRA